MRRPGSGVSLIEVLLAASLFGLLLTAMLGIYVFGVRAAGRGDARVDMMGKLQLASGRLTRDIELSTYDSLSISASGEALSLLSPLDSQGRPVLDAATGTPVWQRYSIYYFEEGSLRHRTVPLGPETPQRTAPTPIEQYAPSGAAAMGLENYLADGQVLEPLTQFTAEVPPGTRLVRMTLTTTSPRPGHPQPERFQLRVTARPRNG